MPRGNGHERDSYHLAKTFKQPVADTYKNLERGRLDEICKYQL